MQNSALYMKLKSLWGIKPEFRLKVLLMSLTFLLMTACQVIWRPLKMAIFSKMVGPTYVPNAKIFSLFILIPLILIYSHLIDWVRRHHLLYCFTILHGIGGLIFFYFLSDPASGIANTNIDPSRWLGWAFYFFMESFDAFFSTTFWSFADSISTPKDARNYYGFFASGSKLGGIASAGGLYLILQYSSAADHISILPNSLLFGSIMLFGAATSIYWLIKRVPEGKMHGYEAVYKLETNRHESSLGILASLKSAFQGLFIIVKNPYVLGIFSLVVFYEVIVVIFDYWVMIEAHGAHKTAGAMTAFYALYYLIMNLIGLVVSFFGTTPILRILGVRMSLFVFPVICLILLTATMICPVSWVLVGTLIGLRAFNYALNHPTREVLYIPTTKAIKFKAKGWTDAFGSRIAKSIGSIFNLSIKNIPPAMGLMLSVSLSLGLTSLWLIIIYFLGKTLQQAIDQKKVIGDVAEGESVELTEDMHEPIK